jgi:hypothetical protein
MAQPFAPVGGHGNQIHVKLFGAVDNLYIRSAFHEDRDSIDPLGAQLF